MCKICLYGMLLLFFSSLSDMIATYHKKKDRKNERKKADQ